MKRIISLFLCVFCLTFMANISFAAAISGEFVDLSENIEVSDDNDDMDDLTADKTDNEELTWNEETMDDEDLDEYYLYDNDETDGNTMAYAAAATSTETNIARGKSVTCTKEQTGSGSDEYNPAVHIVDGNLDTRWSAQGFGNSVTIDLGDVYCLGYSLIYVHEGLNRNYEYIISASTNGRTFKDVVDRSSNAEKRRVYLDELNGEYARYVRLTVTGGSNDWISISEFEIYQFDAEVNWAASGTVTEYSSQQNSGTDINLAKHLIDGDLNTRWSAQGYPNHVVIDLGMPRVITRTEMIPIEGRQYNYEISASLNGKDYYTVVKQKNGIPSMEEDIPPIKARFIRLTVTGRYNNSGDWISISELRLIGTLSNEASPITDVEIDLNGKTVSLTATGNALYGGTVTLVAAVYDGDRMIEIKERSLEFDGVGSIINGSLTLSSDLEGMTVEAFVWDTDETMMSCSETFALSY